MISTCNTCTRTNTTHTNKQDQALAECPGRVPWQSDLTECPDRVPSAYIRSYFCMRWSLLSHYLSLWNACMQTSSTLIPSVCLFPFYLFFKEVRDHVNSNSGEGIWIEESGEERAQRGNYAVALVFLPEKESYDIITGCQPAVSLSLSLSVALTMLHCSNTQCLSIVQYPSIELVPIRFM